MSCADICTGEPACCTAGRRSEMCFVQDGDTDTWSVTGATSDCFTGAALLTNGTVLYAGGECDEVGRNSGAALYDPVAGGFSPTGSMAMPRVWHTLTSLSSRMVLTAGGETPCVICSINSTAAAELYNPSTGAFSSAGNMITPREAHAATLLNDGRVLITGGLSFNNPSGYVYLASAELYIPQKKTRGQITSQ